MRLVSLTLVILAALTLPAPAAPASAPASSPTSQPADLLDPPRGVFADEWYAVMMSGKKCGQMHVRMERLAAAGIDRIQTWSKMQLTVRRGVAEVSVALDSQTTETLDGTPLSFRRVMYLGKQPVITEGTIQDGEVTITTTQFGLKQPSQAYNYPAGGLMEWGTFRQQVHRGLQTGSRYDMLLYDPSISPNRSCPTTVEVVGPETIDLFGRKISATRVRQVTRFPSLLGVPSVQETTLWMTDAGTAVRMEMPILDFRIDVIACPKAVAMAADDPAELMLDTLVPLNQSLNPENARQITFRIRLRKPDDQTPLPPFPETGMQTILAAGAREVTLLVRRSSVPASQPSPPLADEDRRRYLAATASVNYNDPQVAELARQAADGETDPHKLADKLSRFVSGYITDKTLGVGFATASEVARSREGDCTEHGMLLTALARANNIPTRLVTGLVYSDEFEGRSNVLVGHLWTEMWIAGRWIAVDSALRQHTDVDPSHVALAIGSAGDDGFAELIAATWLSLGRFTVDVLRLEP